MGCENWIIFREIIWILRRILDPIIGLTGNNFALALILFTIVVKTLLVPLIVKQQKSMLGMQKVQPYLKELQEKYKNDKQKLQMETMKLYKEHSINPLSSCFPMLIQMPVLFSMWFLIQGMANESLAYEGYVHINGVLQAVNFNLFGLDLSAVPNFDMSATFWGIEVLWIIPLLAGATTYLSSQIMQKFNSAAQPVTADGKNPMKSMMMFFPLFTVFIAFTFPAGVGLYWIISNLLMTAQQWGVSKYLKSKQANSGTEVIEINATQNRKNRKKR